MSFLEYQKQVGFLQNGTQYARQQNVENLGILIIINKTVVITCNFAAISSEYIFIVSKLLKNMVQ